MISAKWSPRGSHQQGNLTCLPHFRDHRGQISAYGNRFPCGESTSSEPGGSERAGEELRREEDGSTAELVKSGRRRKSAERSVNGCWRVTRREWPPWTDPLTKTKDYRVMIRPFPPPTPKLNAPSSEGLR